MTKGTFLNNTHYDSYDSKVPVYFTFSTFEGRKIGTLAGTLVICVDGISVPNGCSQLTLTYNDLPEVIWLTKRYYIIKRYVLNGSGFRSPDPLSWSDWLIPTFRILITTQYTGETMTTQQNKKRRRPRPYYMYESLQTTYLLIYLLVYSVTIILWHYDDCDCCDP